MANGGGCNGRFGRSRKRKRQEVLNGDGAEVGEAGVEGG